MAGMSILARRGLGTSDAPQPPGRSSRGMHAGCIPRLVELSDRRLGAGSRVTAAGVAALAGALVASLRQDRRRKVPIRCRASAGASDRCLAVAEPCFRVEPVEGKGLGAIASRDVAMGELVLREPALIRFRDADTAWVANATKQLDALLKPEQEQVMSLMDAHGPVKSLAGIIVTNNYSLGLGSSYGGIFLELSRFNHSCAPNCEQSWDEDAQEIHVYASTAIRAGEEMYTYFVDPRMSRRDRLQQLSRIYRFTCSCASCTGSGGDPQRTGLLKLGRQIRLLAARDPARGVELVSQLLGVYQQEDITPKSFWKDACYHACQLALLGGDLSAGREWAQRAHAWSIVCHGKGHAETRRLLQIVEAPGDHKIALAWDV